MCLNLNFCDIFGDCSDLNHFMQLDGKKTNFLHGMYTVQYIVYAWHTQRNSEAKKDMRPHDERMVLSRCYQDTIKGKHLDCDRLQQDTD